MWKDVVQNMDNEKVLALVYGTLSALMTAIHAVLVKSAVKTLEGSVLRLNYWSNMLSGLFLVRHLPLYCFLISSNNLDSNSSHASFSMANFPPS